MGWLNFKFAGNAATSTFDTETATIEEIGEKQFTVPMDIRIVDIVSDVSTNQNHQIRFYINGKAQGANFFSNQINPNTQGRLNWANQGITIPKGSTVQLKGSQLTGTAAESFRVLVQFLP